MLFTGCQNYPTIGIAPFHQLLVSEPDPQKIEKEGLVNGARGESVHCGKLGILLIVEPSVASRDFLTEC